MVGKQWKTCRAYVDIVGVTGSILVAPTIRDRQPVDESNMCATTVFISYSHDTLEHSQRVLQLANALRGQGVDAELDHGKSPRAGQCRCSWWTFICIGRGCLD